MSNKIDDGTGVAMILELTTPMRDPEVIQKLEELLADALQGRLLGLVLLTYGQCKVDAVSVGTFTKGEVLLAMEYWKQKHLPNL